MAQTSFQVMAISATHAQNLKAASQSAETIVIDGVASLGLRNVGATVVCYSGSITAVALYGSDDGVNYKAISGFSSFTVASGNMGHQEATATYRFLRLTTTGAGVIDAHLTASQA